LKRIEVEWGLIAEKTKAAFNALFTESSRGRGPSDLII